MRNGVETTTFRYAARCFIAIKSRFIAGRLRSAYNLSLEIPVFTLKNARMVYTCNNYS